MSCVDTQIANIDNNNAICTKPLDVYFKHCFPMGLK